MTSVMDSPCLMVIFGANGDLAQRMLIPSLYHLMIDGRLPKTFVVLGNSRAHLSDQEFREKMLSGLRQHIQPKIFDEGRARQLVDRFHYFSGDTSSDDSFPILKSAMQNLDQKYGTKGHYLFYLATPPGLFSKIPLSLAKVGLLDQSKGWKRVIFEKPFGHDYPSAVELNRILTHVMTEDQIYRIDHYLGKETVRNIMALRFGNEIFEPLWSRNYIDSVQITVSETLGVEDRGAYYDHAGALRDMVPNHLFQLIALIGMEPPNSFGADDVRDEKVKILRAIKRFGPDEIRRDVVRGQYGPGRIDGSDVLGYRSEAKINPHSTTDSFAAMKLEIDNWRWADVPFYLRTGKRMAKRLTEVVIQFRHVPFQMFQRTECHDLCPNRLFLMIQPDERILLSFAAKIPGPEIRLGDVVLDLDYRKTFGSKPQTGYETLLFDAMNGDATLFQRADQVEAAWKVVQPILDFWATNEPHLFPNYAAGSWGPEEADTLLERDHRNWITVPPMTVPAAPAPERGKAA